MTNRQALVPGGAFVNETGTRQALVPGWGFVNETIITSTVKTIGFTGFSTGGITNTTDSGTVGLTSWG